MKGVKNGAVCGIKSPQKGLYRCVEGVGVAHCLIKQKVALLKSNFAQELGVAGRELRKQSLRGREGERGGWERRKQQLAP